MKSEEFRNNPMFLRNQFKGDGVFEIPKIEKEELKLENVELIGYDKLSENETDKIVHFFLDDYKFEVMWNDPEPRIERLKKYKAVLTPNYSIYTEMPLSLKVYNTFRSRWCGAYLQSKGIKVIPTVAWGEPNTFWFCFDGIEKGSTVAVSTLGVRKEKALFLQGYNELIRKVKPQAVICYGEPFEEMQGKIITIDYAQTNNYTKEDDRKKGYIKKVTGYVLPYNEKGMGSAGNTDTPTWKPKKPEDKRFIGKPGEIKESVDGKGEKRLTKIGKNGYATKERHCGDHDYPNKHSSPHDHDIDWQNNHPNLSKPINYVDNAPEFKFFRGDIMSSKKLESNNFESMNEFKDTLLYGKEIVFEWQGAEYGVFYDDSEGKENFSLCAKNENTEYNFSEFNDLIFCSIQGHQLNDIVTEVDVILRNV